MGFRLEYEVRPFDVFMARGDWEDSVFVQGNLSDIRLGGDVEVVNEEVPKEKGSQIPKDVGVSPLKHGGNLR